MGSRSWVAALAGGSSQLEIVGDFLHIDSDWAFFHGRGVSWLQLGRRAKGGSAVDHLYLGAVTVISLKGMVD